MNFFFNNFDWIILNLTLATIPVFLVFMLRKRMHPILHYCLFFLWLLFLPNTIYLVTDLQYLPEQIIRSTMSGQVFLFIQYGSLAAYGIVTYIYALEPIQLIIRKLKVRKANGTLYYIVLHFIVAFAIVLGKVQRTHSWYVFTDFPRVVRDVEETVSSQSLLMWIFFIGIIINILFFLFKKYFIAFQKRKRS